MRQVAATPRLCDDMVALSNSRRHQMCVVVISDTAPQVPDRPGLRSHAMNSAPLYRAPNTGPYCSTDRSAALRERRFQMAYEDRVEPREYAALAEEATQIFLDHEPEDRSMARAMALRHVAMNCPLTLEPGNVLIGGEDPFFFNLLLPALQADQHSKIGQIAPNSVSENLREAGVYLASCFDGHITPGLDRIIERGVTNIRAEIEAQMAEPVDEATSDVGQKQFYEAALISCDSVTLYAERLRLAAENLAETLSDTETAAEMRQAAAVLANVPLQPAQTFHEALQAYWIVYCLVTLEMGGCCPGGGLGLGRLDQFLYPYYQRDIENRTIIRSQALELMEIFLLQFRHVDYYTGHQMFTPGSQASLGGVTPTGEDASNDLSELIMEASLRIAMPAPYISLRLHQEAPQRYWEAAAQYELGGLGFPIVNDEVIIAGMLKHGRSIEDARDYICSCCYENTIPGKEAFHPNAAYLNLPLVLESTLNDGESLLSGRQLAENSTRATDIGSLDELLSAFKRQMEFVAEKLVELVHASDRSHCENRRYPLMSLFIDDCIATGKDVCAGGAKYNLAGCIVSGIPNVVNSLAAIHHCVFRDRSLTMDQVMTALRTDFTGFENVRRTLLAAPKWGNGDADVDGLAGSITDMLYDSFSKQRNPRGGRWQLALYSFAANHMLGEAVGASADGRPAKELLTRNLNPTWGTDKHGPTGVLRSLSHIDFTKSPNGAALDLRFDPSTFSSEGSTERFIGFLKGFVDLGVMEMQLTMVDRETLIAARNNPSEHPNVMVRVAGYSARFVDLTPIEQEEIINRTSQLIA